MADPEEHFITEDHLSILYGLLAAMGISIYLSWGIMFGVWFNVGVYSVSGIMVAFGLIGFFLYSIEEEEDPSKY